MFRVAGSEGFGKEVGLVEEMIKTGRRVGASRSFYAALAHDNDLFQRMVALVALEKGVTITTIGAECSFGVMISIASNQRNYSYDGALGRLHPGLIGPDHFEITEFGFVGTETRLYCNDALRALVDEGLSICKLRDIPALVASCPRLPDFKPIIVLSDELPIEGSVVVISRDHRGRGNMSIEKPISDRHWAHHPMFVGRRESKVKPLHS